MNSPSETETHFQRLSLVFDKTSCLMNKEPNLEIVAVQILEDLGRAMNCEWGTYWQVSEKSPRLTPLVTWVEQGFTAPDLDRDTKSRTLSLSEGTAGHVWRSRKPVWTLDLMKDMCLPRSLDADSSGLTGGIWFALKTENTVFGVIELLGRHPTPSTHGLLDGIERLGIHLGHLLEERLFKL
jgi:two-component system, NtrC family, sensor kinase